jgi:hypothetical protein
MVLPFCAAFFFQKDVVYYATSAYLEPWSIVMALLALEALLVRDPPPAWVPCLLGGLAAMFKEQAIVLLPWIWLAAHRRELKAGRWKTAFVTAGVAGLPFLLYAAVRASRGVVRSWRLAEPDALLAPERASEFLFRMRTQFGVAGLTVVTGLFIALIVLAWRRSPSRGAYACLLGGFLSEVTLFYTDQASIPWTGYPRHHLLALACLCAPLLANGRVVEKRPRLAVGLAALLAMANAPGLASAFALAAATDPARNFVEHYDAPVFYPIRALAARADAAGVDEGVRRVRLVAGETWDFSLVHPVTYRDLADRYQWEAHRLGDGSARLCACEDPDLAVVYLPIYWTGLNSRVPKPPAMAEAERACLRELTGTCALLVSERLDGATLAVWARTGVRSAVARPR